MHGFSFAYILDSLSAKGGYYVGLTDGLSARLAKHNAGGVSHTTKSRPWRIKTALAFRDRAKAEDFESYLKFPSGRAFARKRL